MLSIMLGFTDCLYVKSQQYSCHRDRKGTHSIIFMKLQIVRALRVEEIQIPFNMKVKEEAYSLGGETYSYMKRPRAEGICAKRNFFILLTGHAYEFIALHLAAVVHTFRRIHVRYILENFWKDPVNTAVLSHTAWNHRWIFQHDIPHSS